MQEVCTRGGLSGKARKVHKRRRASRHHMQKLIEDYLDPGSGSMELSDERMIPVGHRRESLLPNSPTFEHIAFGDDRQLELYFNQPEPQTEKAVCFVPGHPRAIKVDDTATSDELRDAAGKIGVRPETLPSARTSDQSAPTFTMRGFLCGCAIGAAAAAVILMIVQTALR